MDLVLLRGLRELATAGAPSQIARRPVGEERCARIGGLRGRSEVRRRGEEHTDSGADARLQSSETCGGRHLSPEGEEADLTDRLTPEFVEVPVVDSLRIAGTLPPEDPPIERCIMTQNPGDATP